MSTKPRGVELPKDRVRCDSADMERWQQWITNPKTPMQRAFRAWYVGQGGSYSRLDAFEAGWNAAISRVLGE